MSISYTKINVSFPKIKRKELKNWIKRVIQQNNKALGEINFIFCSDNDILQINKLYLNHEYYTDIITFDYSDNIKLSGDIYISLETVRANSKRFKTYYDEELRRVIIHGILHLCGYKDKTTKEKKEMHLKENESLLLFKTLK